MDTLHKHSWQRLKKVPLPPRTEYFDFLVISLLFLNDQPCLENVSLNDGEFWGSKILVPQEAWKLHVVKV